MGFFNKFIEWLLEDTSRKKPVARVSIPEGSTNMSPVTKEAAAKAVRIGSKIEDFEQTPEEMGRTPSVQLRHANFEADVRGKVPTKLDHEQANLNAERLKRTSIKDFEPGMKV